MLCALLPGHSVPQGVKGSTFLPAMWPVAPFHSPTPRLYPQSLCVSIFTWSVTGRAMQINTMPCAAIPMLVCTESEEQKILIQRQPRQVTLSQTGVYQE